MSLFDERNADPVREMRKLAYAKMKVASWGFKESYHSAKSGNLIFDSSLCRINFIWGGWDPAGGNSMYIQYGGLHAPDESVTMQWQGEECHCSHDINQPLNFLDELHPADILERYFSHSITAPFFEDDARKKYKRWQPEWIAEMHLTIWHHYGDRFFGLFDVKQSDLWLKYQQFLKEFYDLKGRSLAIKPPLEKVC